MAIRANDEPQRTKRELRLRIGRQRRRIERRVSGVGRKTRAFVSWRTCVRSYPGSAVMAGLGFGLAISTGLRAGLRTGRIARWLGLGMLRSARARATKQFWSELEQIWAKSDPKRASNKAERGRR